MVAASVFGQGGAMMWVILGLSVIASTIALERVLVLFIGTRFGTDRLLERVLRHVEAGEIATALEACNVKSSHPLPAILEAGLRKAHRRPREMEKAMEAEMLHALPLLQRGMGLLGLLGNVATLLGLLGTIFGLIQAFSGVSAASAAARQQVLAEGISVAMYTTAFGIVVAVPILIAHTLLSSRLEVVLVQMEEGAASLVAALSERSAELRVLEHERRKGAA